MHPGHLRNAPASGQNPLLSCGELTLNASTREVSAQGNLVHLTRTECAILNLLMQHPGQVITKSVMLDRISEDTPDCTETSLKVHISNLRKKLRDLTGNDTIEAVWGLGFKWMPPHIETESTAP